MAGEKDTETIRTGDDTVDVLRKLGPERVQCERDLDDAGIPLPLPYRIAWAETRIPAESWFLALRDRTGCCRAGLAIAVSPSRVLPGHRLLRVERLGAALADDVREPLLASLADLARRTSRLLALNVEILAIEPQQRLVLCQALEQLGFRKLASPRNYLETIAFDLGADEQALFAALPASTRRKIRAIAKHPVAVAPIDDPVWATRLEALLAESLQRTGGATPRRNWQAIIALGRCFPARSRLVGLFRTDVSGPDSLLAFMWGCSHGDHAHYEAGASTRETDLRLPLTHALLWDLIVWARRQRADWFDLGGVTAGHVGGEDRLGGISDFKRSFSTNVIAGFEEWVLEPSWLRARVADGLRLGAAQWMRRVHHLV